MSIDELVNRVNDGWGWSSVAVSRTGDGLWTASFRNVVVSERGREVQQPDFRSERAEVALSKLVSWLRGKTVRLQAVAAGRDGRAVRVPPRLRAVEVG